MIFTVLPFIYVLAVILSVILVLIAVNYVLNYNDLKAHCISPVEYSDLFNQHGELSSIYVILLLFRILEVTTPYSVGRPSYLNVLFKFSLPIFHWASLLYALPEPFLKFCYFYSYILLIFNFILFQVLLEFGVHAFICFLFVLWLQYPALLINLPMLAYNLCRYKSRAQDMSNCGLSYPTCVLQAGQMRWARREGRIKLIFYLTTYFYYFIETAKVFTEEFKLQQAAELEQLGDYMWKCFSWVF